MLREPEDPTLRQKETPTVILTFRPIKVWPDGWRDPGRRRQETPFFSNYSTTLGDLEKEIRAIGGRDPFLQVDAAEADVRIDGQLRANARVGHPGVILTFDTKTHGPMVYATDRFTHWHANLRAITLGLEALRKIERYGIAERGQQYAGYRELGAGATAVGPVKMTFEEAARILCDATSDTVGEDPRDLARVIAVARSLWREAAKTLHPDVGGDPELFRRITEARDLLVGSSS